MAELQLSLPPGVQVFERGWLSANNIVFTTGVRAVVDTGYWTHQEQTVQLVEAALEGATLDLILNTHLHSDHCGGNAALKSRYKSSSLLIPPGLRIPVRAWDIDELTYAPTGQFCPQFDFNDLLLPNSEIQLGELRWEIHAAPGHDPHSVILFQPDYRLLISADALWQNGFGVVFPELEGESAFLEVEKTLDLIEMLNPAVIIPGHGSIFSEIAPALARARSRLAGFISDPKKHALHAAKVLMKFKLLELQQTTAASLSQWAAATRFFQTVHSEYFAQEPISEWSNRLIDDLVRSNAATRDQDLVLNR